MPPYIYLILACGWLVWFWPFVFRASRSSKAQTVNPRARWGMVVQAIGYALLWQSRFWLYAPPVWRVLLSILFFIAASVLSWTSVRELGRQWRVDAGLNPDHQLIRTGPYAIVRHPIYTSMLCLFLAIGLLVTPWIRFLVALLVFLAGCGIRMQVENRLLAQHFGAEFAEYKRSVPAMIPGLPKTLLQSR